MTLAISKGKEKITVDSKNKISIITNIEVNINQNSAPMLKNSANNNNNNSNSNNTNIINLNINSNQQPNVIKKLSPSPFILPISQVTNTALNNQNLVLTTNQAKPSDIKPRLPQSSQPITENKNANKDGGRKKDAETQTEEIFFKMYCYIHSSILTLYI